MLANLAQLITCVHWKKISPTGEWCFVQARWPKGSRFYSYQSLPCRLPRSWSIVGCQRATRKRAHDWWRWTAGSLSGSKEPSSPHRQPLLVRSPALPAMGKTELSLQVIYFMRFGQQMVKLLPAWQHFENLKQCFIVMKFIMESFSLIARDQLVRTTDAVNMQNTNSCLPASAAGSF